MSYVLVSVSRGIIEEVKFFTGSEEATMALSDYVKTMDVENCDAALFGENGMLANAKSFLNDQDEFFENRELIDEISRDPGRGLYIIGNPQHPLGFMVASYDDPLGFEDPTEALSELGQMRKITGRHLMMYRIVQVDGPIANRTELDNFNADYGIEDFDYSLVDEYLK